jgi:hypothetical protein
MRSIIPIIKISSIVGVMLIIGVYAYLKSEAFIKGPIIQMDNLTDGMTVTDPLLVIKGAASHVSFINMNDRKIFTDQNGVFSEEMLLYPGYNILTVSAEDRFNRHIEKTIQVVYKGTENGPQTAFQDTALPATN